MPPRPIAADTVAEAFLSLLAARGVDYLFANAGTDFPSIVEAFAKPQSGNFRLPKPITAPHETAAVGMAHGYYMITGRPQAVMVHVNVGTMNALMGLFNADRDQVPIIFAAGRTPILEEGAPGARSNYIHWAQEMYDQGGMLREAVKWDYELRDAAQLEAVVDRALSIAMTEPRGPVALTLPREVLARKMQHFSIAERSLQSASTSAYPDPAAIAEAARILARAERPLIATSSAGRDHSVPALLAELADRFALPVVEYRPRHLNIRTDHPMHAGFDVGPLVGEADAMLVIEADVPWIPSEARPKPDCPVIQIGTDPLFRRYPVRSFRADVAITATPSAAIPALIAALDAEFDGGDARRRAAIDARRKRLSTAHAAARQKLRAAIVAEGREATMSKAFISHCLNAAKPKDAIVVSEYSLQCDAADFTVPGTYFASSPVGGLGWGLPAALGAQLAAPEKMVIATLGDGAYMFANPVACHQISAAHGLPVLTVVFDNAEWGAVRKATKGMYPQGNAIKANRPSLISLEPSPNYHQVSEACGGWGERIEDAAELPKAIDRAMSVVRTEKRQALLNVACG
jgi:acetolactate synthase I/II/III large subunit